MGDASFAAVVKIGGSLFERRTDLERIAARLRAAPRPVLLLTGGGVLADAVRRAQGDLGFSDALAHRLAIGAMEQMAAIFAEIDPGWRLVGDVGAALATARNGASALWCGSAPFLADRTLAEDWTVTSDSLAARLAAGVGAERLVLVKSAEPPPFASLADLAGAGYVDAAFPRHAAAFAGSVHFAGPSRHDGLSLLVTGSEPPVS